MERRGEEGKPLPAEVRWTVGCLVAATALLGMLILLLFLLFLLFLAAEPPPVWVQVLVGAGFVLVGAGMAWLIATALGQRAAREPEPREGHPPPSRDT